MLVMSMKLLILVLAFCSIIVGEKMNHIVIHSPQIERGSTRCNADYYYEAITGESLDIFAELTNFEQGAAVQLILPNGTIGNHTFCFDEPHCTISYSLVDTENYSIAGRYEVSVSPNGDDLFFCIFVKDSTKLEWICGENCFVDAGDFIYVIPAASGYPTPSYNLTTSDERQIQDTDNSGIFIVKRKKFSNASLTLIAFDKTSKNTPITMKYVVLPPTTPPSTSPATKPSALPLSEDNYQVTIGASIGCFVLGVILTVVLGVIVNRRRNQRGGDPVSQTINITNPNGPVHIANKQENGEPISNGHAMNGGAHTVEWENNSEYDDTCVPAQPVDSTLYTNITDNSALSVDNGGQDQYHRMMPVKPS